MYSQNVIEKLTEEYPSLSQQLQIAAKWVLDHPSDVAVTSMRGLAAKIGITPTTMIRLAKRLGFSNYSSFRRVFKNAIPGTSDNFENKALKLQQFGTMDHQHELHESIVSAATGNIEKAFGDLNWADIAKAADILRRSQSTYLIATGALYWLAGYFAFVAGMILSSLRLPQADLPIINRLITFRPDDVALVLSVAPYARETVVGAEFAKRSGGTLIIVTDSRASPLAAYADVLILVPTSSPQFFPSMVSMCAIIEALIATIVSRSDRATIERMAAIDELRTKEGIYWGGPESKNSHQGRTI